MENSKKLYEGNAEIIAVDGTELREYQTKTLSEDDAATGFNLRLTVKPSEEGYDQAVVELEMSKRELTGKLAGEKKDHTPRTQYDMSCETLKTCGLITGDEEHGYDVAKAFDAVGKVIPIYQKYSSDGKYINTNISRGAMSVSKDEIRNRLARLTGRAVTSVASSAPKNPFA